jgi:hypothetical protein
MTDDNFSDLTDAVRSAIKKPEEANDSRSNAEFDELTVGQVLTLWLELYNAQKESHLVLDVVMPNGLKLVDCPAGYFRAFADWFDSFMEVTLANKLMWKYPVTRKMERRNQLHGRPRLGRRNVDQRAGSAAARGELGFFGLYFHKLYDGF